jgi:hypothetical protein
MSHCYDQEKMLNTTLLTDPEAIGLDCIRPARRSNQSVEVDQEADVRTREVRPAQGTSVSLNVMKLVSLETARGLNRRHQMCV